MKPDFEKYGSLATHRAFLGKPPKKGSVEPVPCRPAEVYARQVAGLAHLMVRTPFLAAP